MHDVVIAGGGPAGAVAAWMLARAGARVLIVDRGRWPRSKLCGDTLNPGAVGWLERRGLIAGPLAGAFRLGGMLVSGPRTEVRCAYRPGVHGLAITRRELDAWLLDQAIGAGAEFADGVVVRGPVWVDRRGARHVGGVVATPAGGDRSPWTLSARVVIGADGRSSSLARAVTLARRAARPRRWAYGVYATGIGEVSDLGEMHIGTGRYLGIAPLGRGVCNVCAVTADRLGGRRPLDVVRETIGADARLARRFARARFESEVTVLGPLAVEASGPGVPGLLLAGDAAGFIDPMTGDGLHLALRGAALAAEAARAALESGMFELAPAALADARRRAFAGKLRFNRVLRALVDSPRAIGLADRAAGFAPGLIRQLVNVAGDAA
jgi:flavin-dependent dehydrogenase